MMIRVATLVLALALGFAAHGQGERAGDAQNAGRDPDELLYLPEGRYLRIASLGHRNFLADLVWLRAIQYYGEQRLTTRNYDQAERLFQVIYDLDYAFKGATRFGALVLAQDAGNPEGALKLLKRAAVDNPESWEYPFDEGFIHQTVERDYAAAGIAYRRASQLPEAPPIAARLAGLSFARLGDRSASREVWQAIHDEAENDLMRAVAERNLQNLAMEDAEEVLTGVVLKFREETGRIPANWGELVHVGILGAVPEEPFGGRYLFDPFSDEVWSTTHIDRRMAQERDIYRGFVNQHAQNYGNFPETLDQLVELGYTQSGPWRPLGLQLDYDHASGRVAWSPPWPATERRLHGEGVE